MFTSRMTPVRINHCTNDPIFIWLHLRYPCILSIFEPRGKIFRSKDSTKIVSSKMESISGLRLDVLLLYLTFELQHEVDPICLMSQA